jgi:hypothetical protein
MGLTKEARLIELYYNEHPEKLIVKSRQEIALEEVEIELNKLREKGLRITTIKN